MTTYTEDLTGSWQASYANAASSVITDPNNHAATYKFTGNAENGHVDEVIDGNGNRTSATWDNHNNMMTQTNGTANTTNYSYGGGTGNPNNLLSKVTSPNGGGAASGGASQSLTYPSTSTGGQVDNQPTMSTDGQNNKTAMTWDTSTNQLKSTSTTDAGGASVGGNKTAAYQGDKENTDCGAKQGQMCSSTSANGNKTTYGYDATGNLTSMTPPAPLGSRDYGYDAAGRVTSQSDGRGNTAYFSYDNNDRITRVSYSAPGSSNPCPAASCVSYSYDASGNKTGRTDTGSTTWVYDALNRVTAKKLNTVAGGVTVNSTTISTVSYDRADNKLSYTDAHGTVGYAYDAGNRVISLAEPGGSCPASPASPNSTGCSTFSYDNANRRTGTVYPNGQSVSTAYDSAGRITSITAKKSDGTVIVKRGYTYKSGTSGDQQLVATMKDESNNATNYSYDGLNRLTSTTGTDSGSWSYDKDGNRTKNTTGTGSSATTTYAAYNKADQLCWTGPANGTDCTAPPAGSTRYTSDGTGNQLTDTTSAGAAANDYNVFNQTVQTTVGAMTNPATQTTIGGTATSFTYADTTNTERLTAGNTNYSNGIIGIDAQSTGNTSTYFVRDPAGSLIAMRSGNASYYYTTDALGSVLLLTDSGQNTAASYRYDPWGNPTTTSGALAATNPWRYATSYLDPQTGYLKLGARYYNPTAGRFIQPDPQATWGGYEYAGNNSVSRTDPTGNDSVSISATGCLFGICASIGLGLDNNGNFNVKGSLGVGGGAGVSASYDPQGSYQQGNSYGIEASCSAGGVSANASVDNRSGGNIGASTTTGIGASCSGGVYDSYTF